MGKFLKRAGSLLTVPFLPGKAGRSLQGAGRAGCLQEKKGAWWEQMPGLWWLLAFHSLRPRRWMVPSQTAGLPVLCFPGGGIALKLCKTRSTLTLMHIVCLRDRGGWHLHTLCASTAHIRPVLPWLVREKSSLMESQLPCTCVSAFYNLQMQRAKFDSLFQFPSNS